MTFDEYLDIDAWNWSLLKEGRKSARHIAHRKASPREDTTTLKVGRAGHTAILEPHRFDLDYAVWDGDRRGKAFAAFAEANAHRTVIRATERDACLGMRDAVRSHPKAGPLLATGEPEVPLVWTDPETGLKCKGRIDWLDHLIVDLKTSGDITPVRFGMNAGRLGYHGQMAFYRRGVKAVRGDEPEVKIIAVESAPPHDVAVFTVSEDDLFLGDCEVSRLLQMVARCLERNEWPGAYPDETPLILPSWMFGEGADDDADGLGIHIPAEEAA